MYAISILLGLVEMCHCQACQCVANVGLYGFLYHYIGGDYRRLNIMLLVKYQWQTCCLSCTLMG